MGIAPHVPCRALPCQAVPDRALPCREYYL